MTSAPKAPFEFLGSVCQSFAKFVILLTSLELRSSTPLGLLNFPEKWWTHAQLLIFDDTPTESWCTTPFGPFGQLKVDQPFFVNHLILTSIRPGLPVLFVHVCPLRIRLLRKGQGSCLITSSLGARFTIWLILPNMFLNSTSLHYSIVAV